MYNIKLLDMLLQKRFFKKKNPCIFQIFVSIHVPTPFRTSPSWPAYCRLRWKGGRHIRHIRSGACMCWDTYMLGYSTYIHTYIYIYLHIIHVCRSQNSKVGFFIQPLTYICFRPPSSTKCARSNIHYRIEIYVFPNMQICMATSGTSP